MYIILYYIILYHIILYYIILYHIILYHIISYIYILWRQHVATKVNHKTMEGLKGIDPALTLLDHDKQPAIDLARTRALQSGAFISSWHHSKFDRTKQPICQMCLLPDTHRHWFRCPRFAAQREECADFLSWVDELPLCA